MGAAAAKEEVEPGGTAGTAGRPHHRPGGRSGPRRGGLQNQPRRQLSYRRAGGALPQDNVSNYLVPKPGTCHQHAGIAIRLIECIVFRFNGQGTTERPSRTGTATVLE